MPSRFSWLMGLHGENYLRLARLFAPQRLIVGSYRSSVDDHLDVLLEVVEHHPYTIDLVLTYALHDADTGGLVPSANIRMYRDARMAEVLHYHADRRLENAIGPLPPAHTILERRVRKSTFLNRWLEYLAEQGHSIGTLEPVVSPGTESQEAFA
ncbi:MAG TPA: DUF1249 domain-containing protein [Dokdonella sp.]|uniref:DUF1249 domain-containing protein n=1 Tax=Dokdonella sp. TaxID=2291710 RepID=UPI002D8084B4|nr:DUF1249 domain-containing protein [Dokdonella sp.]HET9033791.1 DUF1249 domain-containing protein [Dokdonella sp.]